MSDDPRLHPRLLLREDEPWIHYGDLLEFIRLRAEQVGAKEVLSKTVEEQAVFFASRVTYEELANELDVMLFGARLDTNDVFAPGDPNGS